MSEFDKLEEVFRAIDPKSSSVGKRLVKYDRAWIIVGRIKENLWLAVEGGTSMPCPVHVIKATAEEFLKMG